MSKMKGNGLGEKNAKSWNPGSVRNERGPDFGQKTVESHTRKGAGQKK